MKFIKKYNESIEEKPDIDLINDILVDLKDEGFLIDVDIIYSKDIDYIDISISLPLYQTREIIDMNTADTMDYLKSINTKKPIGKGRYSRRAHVFFKRDEVINTIETLIGFLDKEYSYKLYYIDLRPEMDKNTQNGRVDDTIFLDVTDNNIDELYKYEYYTRIDLTFRYL